MSEVEYNLLLEAVQTAIAPAPEDDFVVQTQRRFSRRRVPPTTTGALGRWCRFPRAGTPPADRGRPAVASRIIGAKPLIIWMEATTRIELVYTVLQTVA